MNPIEYATLAEVEESYWWHIGRRSILSGQIKELFSGRRDLTILNVGSGTGGTVSLFSDYGTVLNVDRSSEAVVYMRRKGYEALQLDATKLPFEDEHFDLIAALDVLEHIEDDGLALAEWGRLLRPGGCLVLTVPAYQWLWSGHDESLNHFRRYTAPDLRKLADETALEVHKCSYAITFSFPMVVAFRFLQKLLRPRVQRSSYVILPRWLNAFFITLLRMEAVLLRICDFPFGTSVLMVLSKPLIASRHIHVDEVLQAVAGAGRSGGDHRRGAAAHV